MPAEWDSGDLFIANDALLSDRNSKGTMAFVYHFVFGTYYENEQKAHKNEHYQPDLPELLHAL